MCRNPDSGRWRRTSRFAKLMLSFCELFKVGRKQFQICGASLSIGAEIQGLQKLKFCRLKIYIRYIWSAIRNFNRNFNQTNHRISYQQDYIVWDHSFLRCTSISESKRMCYKPGKGQIEVIIAPSSSSPLSSASSSASASAASSAASWRTSKKAYFALLTKYSVRVASQQRLQWRAKLPPFK